MGDVSLVALVPIQAGISVSQVNFERHLLLCECIKHLCSY